MQSHVGQQWTTHSTSHSSSRPALCPCSQWWEWLKTAKKAVSSGLQKAPEKSKCNQKRLTVLPGKDCPSSSKGWFWTALSSISPLETVSWVKFSTQKKTLQKQLMSSEKASKQRPLHLHSCHLPCQGCGSKKEGQGSGSRKGFPSCTEIWLRLKERGDKFFHWKFCQFLQRRLVLFQQPTLCRCTKN